MGGHKSHFCTPKILSQVPPELAVPTRSTCASTRRRTIGLVSNSPFRKRQTALRRPSSVNCVTTRNARRKIAVSDEETGRDRNRAIQNINVRVTGRRYNRVAVKSAAINFSGRTMASWSAWPCGTVFPSVFLAIKSDRPVLGRHTSAL